MAPSRQLGTPPPFVGNAPAKESLRTAISGQSLPHSLLFTGPPQVGKGTLAAWLAQALLCDRKERDGDEPCGECRACVRIAHGTHPDVQTFGIARQAESSDRAAASRELGIGAVREIVGEIDLLPFEAERKVYIIEDAGTLTEEAANALLKTLEEPPAYATLVLVAEDERTLPDTIRSRCVPVRLGPVPDREILALLSDLAGVEPATAQRLAALAAGRPGWALATARDPKALERHDANIAALLDALGSGAAGRIGLAEKMAKRWTAGHRLEVYATLFDWLGFWRHVLHVAAETSEPTAYPERRADVSRLAGRGIEPAADAARRTVEAVANLDANANTRMTVETLLLRLPPVGTFD